MFSCVFMCQPVFGRIQQMKQKQVNYETHLFALISSRWVPFNLSASAGEFGVFASSAFRLVPAEISTLFPFRKASLELGSIRSSFRGSLLLDPFSWNAVGVRFRWNSMNLIHQINSPDALWLTCVYDDRTVIALGSRYDRAGIALWSCCDPTVWSHYDHHSMIRTNSTYYDHVPGLRDIIREFQRLTKRRFVE